MVNNHVTTRYSLYRISGSYLTDNAFLRRFIGNHGEYLTKVTFLVVPYVSHRPPL